MVLVFVYLWKICFQVLPAKSTNDYIISKETPSGFADTESLKEKVLRILKQIHQEKEEEMVVVDIWCHFGHAYLIKVDEGQSCRFYESFGELVRYQLEIFSYFFR